MKLRTLFLGASIAAGLAAGVLFMVSRQNVPQPVVPGDEQQPVATSTLPTNEPIPSPPAEEPAVISPSVTPTNSPYVITGLTLDPSGTPAAGAVVRLEAIREEGEQDGAILETNSDTTGAFRFGVDSAGAYSLEAQKGGRIARSRTGISDSKPVVDIVMVLAAAGVLRGQVLNEGRSPVPAAEVSILRRNGRESRALAPAAKTDDIGAFLLEDLVLSAYELLVTAPGYAPAVSAPAVPGEGEVVVVLTRGAQVRGKLVEQATQVPLASVTLRLYPENAPQHHVDAVTGPNGVFTFERIAATPFSLSTVDKAWHLARGMEFFEEVPQNALTLEAVAGASVFLSVENTATSQPIVGARLRIKPQLWGRAGKQV